MGGGVMLKLPDLCFDMDRDTYQEAHESKTHSWMFTILRGRGTPKFKYQFAPCLKTVQNEFIVKL